MSLLSPFLTDKQVTELFTIGTTVTLVRRNEDGSIEHEHIALDRIKIDGKAPPEVEKADG